MSEVNSSNPQIKPLLLDEIEEHEQLLVRVVPLQESTVRSYMEIINRLPPIVVFKIEGKYYLVSGKHRLTAYKRKRDKDKKGRYTKIPAEILEGTLRDVKLYAIASNKKHGLRYNQKDKRKNVNDMLDDSEWWDWSDLTIAKEVGVSKIFVWRLRQKHPKMNNGPRNIKFLRGGKPQEQTGTAKPSKKKKITKSDSDDETEVPNLPLVKDSQPSPKQKDKQQECFDESIVDEPISAQTKKFNDAMGKIFDALKDLYSVRDQIDILWKYSVTSIEPTTAKQKLTKIKDLIKNMELHVGSTYKQPS